MRARVIYSPLRSCILTIIFRVRWVSLFFMFDRTCIILFFSVHARAPALWRFLCNFYILLGLCWFLSHAFCFTFVRATVLLFY